MNLTLLFLWREWRAQRGVLLGYTGLALLALMLAVVLVPERWWQQDGRGAMWLAWFAVVGAFGVTAFVAPGLVTSEFGSKDDQFVRRLPGALWPSFRGKLLFLLLATLLLPLLGLLCGELWLQWLDRSYGDLWVPYWDAEGAYELRLEVPWPAFLGGAGVLLAPWVWAVGTWLPKGRMALGGALVLGLLVGVGIWAIQQQRFQIFAHLPLWPWLVLVVLSGGLVAARSWGAGRRGGGAWRSARVGLATCGVVLAGPGAWLGLRVAAYDAPDPATVHVQNVTALSPDHRYALVYGATEPEWHGAPFRVDLQTGAATRLGDWRWQATASVLNPWSAFSRGGARFVRGFDFDRGTDELLDLTTGERQTIARSADPGRLHAVPAALQPALQADLRATTRIFAPGGVPVWIASGAVHFGDGAEHAQGLGPGVGYAVGHGLRGYAERQQVWFDLSHRRAVQPPQPKLEGGFAVRGRWLWRSKQGVLVQDLANDDVTPWPELRGYGWLGLVDDDRLLVVGKGAYGNGLRLVDPATRTVEPLSGMPVDAQHRPVEWEFRYVLFPIGEGSGTHLPRDPAGRIWLGLGRSEREFLCLGGDGAVTHRTLPPKLPGLGRLLAWTAVDRALVLYQGLVLEVDYAAGTVAVRFPTGR